MQVLIVTTWWPSDEQPGMGPFNVAHAKAIARRHNVRVVRVRRGAGARTDTTDPSGLPLTTVSVDPRKPLATARGLNELRKLVRSADVVHTMAYNVLTILAPLYPLIRDRWVHTEHWSALVNDQAKVPRVIAESFRLPRGMSAASDALREALEALCHKDIAVIPNVIGERFEAGPQPPWEPIKLVAVGMLIERKRPLLAVDTLAHLVASGYEASLTWVGDGPLRDAMSARAAELGVRERLTLTGQLDHDAVPARVAAANVFFLPTEAETFLVAAAEAIAAGRPVVLPRLPCFDYVDEENGALVSVPSAEAFAGAIVEVRNKFRDTPAEQIRATVLPAFGEEEVARRFDELYETLRK